MSLFRPVLLLILLCMAGFASAETPIQQGWEYRWGDSPFDEAGEPVWSQEKNATEWQAIDYPSDPPGRAGQTNLWFRVTLPEEPLRDPVLYISSVDLLVEAYLDGEKIYQHGQFDQQGRGEFSGWPWHMLTLPADYAGKTLYFRVFSDYLYIGLWGEVKVSERIDILEQVFAQSSEGLVVAGLTTLIALMAAIFAFLKGQRRLFLSICLFSLAAAGLVLGDIPAMQLLLDKPLLWNVVGAYAYFLLPVPMFLLLGEWLAGAERQVRYYQWSWKFHLLFLLGASIGNIFGFFTIPQLYPVFDVIFTLSLVLLVISVLFIYRRVRLEQKILILSYFGFCAVMMIDMAVAHNWLSWTAVPVSTGALIFSLAIIGLAFNHYLATQRRLAVLNLELEARVNERTQQLAELAEEERSKSEALLFLQDKSDIHNRIALELESCKTLATGLEKVGGLIRSLCSPLSGQFWVCQDDRWELVACWGTMTTADKLVAADFDSMMIDDLGAIYPFKIGNERVALLKVRSENPIQVLPQQNFLQLLQRLTKRISITLANIALREELQRHSYEDVLTGLKNRRFFAEMLEHEIALAQRNQDPLSVMICDIDLFKGFNDSHGHTAGDEALKVLAGLLTSQFRKTDIACRLGGEEFVVILPGSGLQDSLAKAQKLLKRVASTPVYFNDENLGSLTLSIGVASWPELTADPERLLSMADIALYEAKEKGRNRIEQAARD